jgi:predicted RNA-binding Zn ribbon-like protein
MDKAEREERESKHGQADESFYFVGEYLALDLVNTEAVLRGKQHDLLVTPEDVRRWWQEACRHQMYMEDVRAEGDGEPVFDAALFDALKTLRAVLRHIFSACVEGAPPPQADLHVLNDVLQMGYHWLEYTQDGSIQDVYRTRGNKNGEVLLPIALSARRLLCGGDRKRLHKCDSERCILFFYDTTRNRTRRWCSLGCMERVRSAQRYKRSRQESHSFC